MSISPSAPIDEPQSPSTVPTTRIVVHPWLDPVVDDTGHDPRSRYVELFWLGVLGPTATWLLRRLVAGFEQHPDGYELDLEETARSMGLGYVSGRTGPFHRAIQRCVMFGVAHRVPDGLAVRRRVPTLSGHHVRRMPESLRLDHHEWIRTTIHLDELTRAHGLATTLFDLGDDAAAIEHHLVALGVRQPVAAEVIDNAFRLRQAG